MVHVRRLLELPFFQSLPVWAIRRIAKAADERSFDRNELIIRQHDEAHSVFFLLSGAVQFLVRCEGHGDLLVGTSRCFGTLIGWSVWRVPHRYTASVRCEVSCRLLRVPEEVITQVLEQDPSVGYMLYKKVATVLADRLEQSRDLLVSTAWAVSPAVSGSGMDR